MGVVNESWDVIDEFDTRYRIAGESVVRRIEVKTIGSDYGASSYTTRDQADRLASLLALAPGRTLLDVGSGAGWPGIYVARTTGCDVFLADLPPEGLRRAHRRMLDEGVRGVVVAAGGAELPLRDEALEAATSSDVLC